MIKLTLKLPGKAAQPFQSDKPTITIGRAAANDVALGLENVSSRHGHIALVDGKYVYKDLKSTNGSLVVRGENNFLLDRPPREIVLQQGDVICLASNDNQLVVDWLDTQPQFDEDIFEQTILAEQGTAQPAALETSLSEDSIALRALVALARELTAVDTPQEIADLVCRLSLEGFPRARRVMYLAPHEQGFGLEASCSRDDEGGDGSSTLMNMRPLIDRCLQEQKGYLFMFEENQMQAVATRIMQPESMEADVRLNDRVVLCCPVLHKERCFGFIEIEGELDSSNRQSLNRRDLALATLMAHLIAARLHDLEQQVVRLKLARKATAGFLAAMVGHCFKNLLFVPMSMGRMLPRSLEAGRQEEVEWLLARNSVSIRYLDILSNEFAAASKDPTEGFENFDIRSVLEEVCTLASGTAPHKVECRLQVPDDPVTAVIHPAALKRLLMNLALNAVDAIFAQNRQDKGIITLGLHVDEKQELAFVEVSDNGPGIPQDVIENLRSIYEKVRKSTDALGELQNIAEEVRSTKEKGFKEHYGLGFLFVCQTVHQHQADMSIETFEGEGTRFVLQLPLRGPGGSGETDTGGMASGPSGDTNTHDGTGTQSDN